MSKLDDLLQRFVDDGKYRFWVVVCVGLALFLVFAAAHGAEYYAKDVNGNVVRLFDKPCSSPELLAKANDALKPLVKDAEMTYRGRKLRACWVATPDARVHIIDEDLDVTVIGAQHFQKAVDA